MIALVENNPQALQSNSAAVLRRFSDGNVPLARQRTARVAKPRPTIEELREYLDYDPESGVLTWKKSAGTRAQGTPTCSGLSGDGYKQLQFRGTNFKAHRVAFALHHGHWPTPYCDHIDGDPLNNRADNLRECSPSENQHNRRIRRDNTTGIKGVMRKGNGYIARVRIKGVSYTKYFRSLKDAAAYAKQLREQLHGEFARHE